ncbi:MAG: CerR family C-terminal domain-containing protein [Cystobacter sp.]
MDDGFEPALKAARTALASRRREAMIRALQDLVERIADLTMPRTEEEGWRRFFGRCQTPASNNPAFALLEREFSVPIKSMVVALVTQVLGLQEGDERARIRALRILGQLWVVHAGADRTLEELGWPDFAGERAALIKEILREHVGRLMASQ